MPKPRRGRFLLLTALALAPLAHAWGPAGHQIVAELAQRHLSPAAEAAVERLLAPEHTTRLADIANWADTLRNDPAQQNLWKITRSQHFINFAPGSCDYVPARDCRDGQCVVAAINRQVAALGDRSKGDAERLQALKFVVHFIGDVHQPLHAGARADKGGNDYQVQFEGKGSNLHRVWDSGLLGTRRMDWRAYAGQLDAQGPAALPVPIVPLDDPAAQWAEESCRAVAAPGFYPAGHAIDDAYVSAHLPLAETRLREAGRRLAEVLNQALDPRR